MEEITAFEEELSKKCKEETQYHEKIIDFTSAAAKEDKLEQISSYLEQLKTSLAELTEEYESQNADEEKVTALTEALDALEDAYDAIEEVLLDEVR